jgi:outer membrane protein assembly factor BamD (BamD/ComL family)
MEKSSEDSDDHEEQGPQLSAEEHKNEGNNRLREGKIQEAIDHYSKSIGNKTSFESSFLV